MGIIVFVSSEAPVATSKMSLCQKNNLFLLFIFLLGCCHAGNSGESQDSSYDFIVVGGGTSGCVVAASLAEKDYSVLLLEAGDDPGDALDVPATMMSLYTNPKYTKVYSSMPQQNAGLANNGVVKFMIGQTLGGGSSVNAMMHNRGSPHDYDYWANVTGDPSWSYGSLLRLFRKMEDYRGEWPNEKQHGTGGPIPIESGKYRPGLDAWLEAGKFLGYPEVDPNGPQKPSFTPIEYSRKGGRRMSAFSGYVMPLLETRSNLNLVTRAVVKRIVFSGNRAVGVTYVSKEGELISVGANKEVVISAGTIDSAALLMRSGIGPKDVLEEAGIKPVKVLPVGHNLQDHVFLKLDFIVDKDKVELYIPDRDLTPEAWRLFEEKGDGPYSSPHGAHCQAFLVSEKRKSEEVPNPEWPDIQLLHLQSPAKLGLTVESKEGNTVTISTIVTLGRPKSRGSVRLNPDDVDGVPLINFGFFTEEEDMEVMLEGVKLTLRLFEDTPTYQQQGAKYSPVPYGKCGHLEFRSPEYWKCFIRHLTGSGLKAGGTCRMGRGEEDKSAVVNSRLKVIGVDALRIVDLSIMPSVTNANTQAAAYVIAEKASEMLLEEWERKKYEQKFEL